MTFQSEFKRVGHVAFPKFSGLRVMMMPVRLGDEATVPAPYQDMMRQLFALCPEQAGKVGYLTIDEKFVPAGEPHRLGGAHVDGIFEGKAGGIWGGEPSPGGGWGSARTGMLTVASEVGCRAWQGTVDGWPGFEGECAHLVDQLGKPTVFQPGDVYWLGGLCVHESMPQPKRLPRQFVRLSMPSEAPWFEGYTPSPVGVAPTGPILPRRRQMDRG